MARCKTQEEINQLLTNAYAKQSQLEKEISAMKSDLNEIQEEIEESESELESLNETIEDLENYEDPRSPSEQSKDATKAVFDWLNNMEGYYNSVLGQDAETIEAICREIWPDGICNNEDLDNVDWNELESDFADPDAIDEDEESDDDHTHCNTNNCSADDPNEETDEE